MREMVCTLKRRLESMLALPLASLDRLAVKRQIENIGSRWAMAMAMVRPVVEA
jgi:hypothetical protein